MLVDNGYKREKQTDTQSHKKGYSQHRIVKYWVYHNLQCMGC